MITYNGHQHFGEQLESILGQSHPIRLDIFDDCSNHYFIEQLDRVSKNYPDVKIHHAEENQGVIGNVKRALSDFSEPYIALSDQDDVWLPNKIQLTTDTLREIEEPGMPALVHHDMSIIDENGSLKPSSFWEVMRQHNFKHNFEANVIINLVTGCASLMNKELANFARDIPEDLNIYHDAWLGMVAYTMGKTESIYEVLSQHRQHNDSLTFSRKTKLSIFSRIKLNALQLLGIENTFESQYAFIDRFLDTYYSQLDSYHKAYFKSFLSLKNKSHWAQKKFIWKAFSKDQ